MKEERHTAQNVKIFASKIFFKDFMKQYCRKTCGYCTGGTTDPPPQTLPPQTLPPGKTTSKPYTGKCGQPEVRGPRVIGGTSARRGVWPWQILLIFRGYGNCGGTLIAPQWVVTAAHCVYGREKYPSSYVVRVGEYNRFVEQGSEINVRVTKIIRYRGYDPRQLNNDIALLKLDFPVILDKYVQPACLPSQNAPVGSECYITGWGQIKHPGDMVSLLQQGMLPVVSNKKCYERNKHSINVPITDAMICGGDNTRTSGCHGDSGGPYVCKINGRWELHGAVSHGSGSCTAKDAYTVFSRVYHFKDWIQKNIASQ